MQTQVRNGAMTADVMVPVMGIVASACGSCGNVRPQCHVCGWAGGRHGSLTLAEHELVDHAQSCAPVSPKLLYGGAVGA